MANPITKIDMDNGNFPYATDIGKVLAKTTLHNSHRAILDAIFNKTFAWHDEDSPKQQKHKKRKTKAIIRFQYFEEFTGLRPGKLSYLLKQLSIWGVILREKIGREHSYSFNVNVNQWDRKIFRKKFQDEGWGIVTSSGNLLLKKEESTYAEEKEPKIVTQSGNRSKEPIVTSSGKSELPQVVSEVTSSGNLFSLKTEGLSGEEGMPNINSLNKSFKLKKITESSSSENPKEKPLTKIQEVVEYWKKIKGFDVIDGWDKANFSRCTKSAKLLLEMAKDDIELVKRGIIRINTSLTRAGFTCTLETILKHFPTFLIENKSRVILSKKEEPKKNYKLASDMTDEEWKKMKEEVKNKLREMGINPDVFFKSSEKRRFCSEPISIGSLLISPQESKSEHGDKEILTIN